MADRLGRFVSVWCRDYVHRMSAFGGVFSARDAVPLRDRLLSRVYSVLWNVGVHHRVGFQLVSICMGVVEDVRRMDRDTCRARDDVLRWSR